MEFVSLCPAFEQEDDDPFFNWLPVQDMENPSLSEIERKRETQKLCFTFRVRLWAVHITDS